MWDQLKIGDFNACLSMYQTFIITTISSAECGINDDGPQNIALTLSSTEIYEIYKLEVYLLPVTDKIGDHVDLFDHHMLPTLTYGSCLE